MSPGVTMPSSDRFNSAAPQAGISRSAGAYGKSKRAISRMAAPLGTSLGRQTVTGNAQGQSLAWQRGRSHYVAVKMNTQNALFPVPHASRLVGTLSSEQHLGLALDHASAE